METPLYAADISGMMSVSLYTYLWKGGEPC